MSVQTLNQDFPVGGQVRYRTDDSGLVFAEIDNAQARASLCLQGAHLSTWRPKSQAEPVVWLSPAAKFAPGKSIRGGAPVCWPWFGPHATHSAWPAHGYARTTAWQLTGAAALDSGTTQLRLMLAPNDATRAQWPADTPLELTATIGEQLRLELATTHRGAQPVVIGEALHTYFAISDIAAIEVQGLDGCAYLDKVDGAAHKTQRGAVAFAGEVERVYLNTMADCVIVDAPWRRRIRVAKAGSRSTVLWTPWTEKAQKMGDFGPGRDGRGGWREMVCVETANAADNVIELAPGERHEMSMTVSVEAL
jgi:D-hexose-6-phosphate mutarotase